MFVLSQSFASSGATFVSLLGCFFTWVIGRGIGRLISPGQRIEIRLKNRGAFPSWRVELVRFPVCWVVLLSSVTSQILSFRLLFRVKPSRSSQTFWENLAFFPLGFINDAYVFTYFTWPEKTFFFWSFSTLARCFFCLRMSRTGWMTFKGI